MGIMFDPQSPTCIGKEGSPKGTRELKSISEEQFSFNHD